MLSRQILTALKIDFFQSHCCGFMSGHKRRALDDGRLLIVSVAENLPRTTQHSAHQRNKFILSHAANIIIGYAAPKGRLHTAITQTNTPATFLYEG